MIEEEICNLMIKSFLNNPLFKRYKRILINTVNTNIESCSKQLIKRRFLGQQKRKQREAMKNLGFDSLEDAKKFHKSVYSSWEHNIKDINAERVQSMTVDKAGNLILDNNVIFTNWRGKVIKRR